MEISPGTLEDLPALTELLRQLFTQEIEFAPDNEAQRQGLAEILSNPAIGIILVARDAGAVKGMANILFSVSTALGARVAILDDFVVTSDWRGRGIGGELITRAIALARDHGCKRLSLQTDRLNTDAQRFYARYGFVASTMVPMRLSLD
jgi:GNAT superfamily N-acetyltransferase